MFAYYKIELLVILSAILFSLIHAEGVDSDCFDEHDCGLWHFVCENGKCKCDKDHIPDKDYKWCAVDILKPCGYHDTCFDPNADCQDVAIPKFGTCKCKKGFTLHMEKMVCSVIIGNKCNVTTDCIEGTCSQELCICNNPLEPNINGTKCLPALHDDCSQYNECAKENAICNSQTKKCECDKNFKEAVREKDTLCLAMLGNTCKNNTDCADEGADCIAPNVTQNIQPVSLKYSYYSFRKVEKPEVNKTCVCGQGYVQSTKQSECLKIVTELNGPCQEDIQCTKFSGFGSECKTNKCICKEGFYFDIDFDRCVRSCLCEGMTKEINNMKQIMKDLKPFVEILAKSNNVNVTRVLRKLQRL